MLDVTIIAVGTLRDPEIRLLCGEYEKRIRPFARLTIIETKSEPFRDGSQSIKAKQKEGERVVSLLSHYPSENIRLLSERGAQSDSLRFSKIISQKPIVFAIGGALGWSDDVLMLPYQKISLSELTFPHELARLILLEQIYRGATIEAGKKYHY